MVPKLTLEPPYGQIWRLPGDRQSAAARAQGRHVGGWVWPHCRSGRRSLVTSPSRINANENRNLLKLFLFFLTPLVSGPSLTVVVRGQVDGFGPDGPEVRRHFQPQFVAVCHQRQDGALSPTGAALQAGGALVAHVLARPLHLLHHLTGQVGPPATNKRV